jgi:hypothetical protein
VEINIVRMLAHEFGNVAAKKANTMPEWKKLLRNKKGLDLASLPHYRTIDELRCLNNKIKHEDWDWRDGNLDKAYARLRPKVPAFIFCLAVGMKLIYKRPPGASNADGREAPTDHNSDHPTAAD